MIVAPIPTNIKKAAVVLSAGDLIGLPTETVYGLAADATNDTAVAKIFSTKNRPSINPLIIHSHSIEILKNHVMWNEAAQSLATTFWPGPLTLVLPRLSSSTCSLLCSAGMDTLAVRIPNHPVALALLEEFNNPVAAPSANPSGKLSPTHPAHVEECFSDLFILNGGDAYVGIESTIIDLSCPEPQILRPGSITLNHVEPILGPIKIPTDDIIKAPGMLKSHYAPHLPIRLNADKPMQGEAYLGFGKIHCAGSNVLNLSEKGCLIEAAANLFKMLHILDNPTFSRISIAPIPMHGLGIALNDRLERAASPREF